MANRTTKRDQEMDLIQRVLAAVLKEQSDQKKEVANILTAPPLRNRGRRYSPSEKETILLDAAQGKTPDELTRKYGVSRESVTRWQRREERSVQETSRAPKDEAPVKNRGSQEREDRHQGYHPHWREILNLWRSRPGLGPAQIRNQLFRGGIKINVGTVRKILEENGYTPPKSSFKEVELNCYEAVRPLELVHMDFKHFYINRQKVYLLLLQDDFSRFLCSYRMTDSENMKTVIEACEESINRYGKMQAVMTDAGSAFYCWNGINRFQRLLSEEYGVDQIKARTPRSNGKIENVNKQIEKEVLNVRRYASLNEADEAIGEWIRFYNFERTHLGLPAGTVPADRFLFGWNQGLKDKGASVSARSSDIEMTELTEVLKAALSQLKRAA